MRVRGSAHLCVLCFAVIRAKVVSEKEVGSGNDVYGNPIKRIQYEIKQIKVRGGKAAGGQRGVGGQSEARDRRPRGSASTPAPRLAHLEVRWELMGRAMAPPPGSRSLQVRPLR